MEKNIKVTNKNVEELFNEIKIGDLTLKNRICMAAMTRCGTIDGIPNELYKEYYTQRANDAGLILTECIAVSNRGEGFPGNCQGFKDEHRAPWKDLIESVHKNNGVIFAQIVHAGRAAAQKMLDGDLAYAPSAIKNRSREDYETPKEMTKDEIKEVIGQFIHTAKLLKDAGIDGVELHSANGYLIDQFLKDGTNKRTDEYGGSVENRSRFLLEIVDEMIKIFGSKRVACKLTPVGRYNDMFDSDPQKLLNYLLHELNDRNIGFIELGRPDGYQSLYEIKGEDQIKDVYEGAKKILTNVVLMGNCRFSGEEASEYIKEKRIEMVSFATNYIGNPDLAKRIAVGYELTSPDWSKAYGPTKEGFTDYKFMETVKN